MCFHDAKMKEKEKKSITMSKWSFQNMFDDGIHNFDFYCTLCECKVALYPITCGPEVFPKMILEELGLRPQRGIPR